MIHFLQQGCYMKADELTWGWPLLSCHEGIPLGNGRMGVLIWGKDRTLRLTLGRPDFWDHRGGMRWTSEMSFARIRSLLESKDEAGLRAIFENGGGSARPMRPSILPVGRVEVTLPDVVDFASLDMNRGVATVRLQSGDAIHIELSTAEPVLILRAGKASFPMAIIPSYQLCKPAEAFQGDWYKRDLPEPESFEVETVRGFGQALPADPAMGVAAYWSGGTLFIASERGDDAHSAFDGASVLALRASRDGGEAMSNRSRAWWAQFWATAPRISTPNTIVNHLARFGLYKLAASTNPLNGVACGLQGPWIEDDGLPAWASDFHFNINVQLCHAPAYPAGAGSHLRPLWDMLLAWEPQLRENARLFCGIGDGLMLPHAVDDRGTNMGGFWTGTVDHACTAWVAKMMFDAWRYGFEDDAFLRDRVQPWLEGALNVYRAMSERRDDGSYVLPVTVSPEYRGSSFDAWGENASAQLAACHALLDALEVTCAALNLPYRSEWTEIRNHLPRACVESRGAGGWNHPAGDTILLWKNTPLEESHRHHSHLFGIYPFESIDPQSEVWRKVVDSTLRAWVLKGPGWWAGWSFGWASQIHARNGNAVAAVMMLEHFACYFVNKGHAGFHNALHRGLSILSSSGGSDGSWNAMQLDGGQGACAAVFDLLAHDRRGVTVLFAGCPSGWDAVSFDDITLPGGFRVSATRAAGKLTRLLVRAERDGVFRYHDPGPNEVRNLSVVGGMVTQII